MQTEIILLAGMVLFLYLAFLFWYGGRGKPLSKAEVDALLVEMQKRAGKPVQVEEPVILKEFRVLTKNDDGREYYMVNLLKFRKKALFPMEVHLTTIRWRQTPGTTGQLFHSCSNMAGTRSLTAWFKDGSSTLMQPRIGTTWQWCAIEAAEIC